MRLLCCCAGSWSLKECLLRCADNPNLHLAAALHAIAGLDVWPRCSCSAAAPLAIRTYLAVLNAQLPWPDACGVATSQISYGQPSRRLPYMSPGGAAEWASISVSGLRLSSAQGQAQEKDAPVQLPPLLGPYDASEAVRHL